MKRTIAMLILCCATGFAAADATVTESGATSSVRDQYRAHAHKPTLPVSIHAVVPADITPGQPVTFNVDVTSALDDGELTVNFVPMDALTLVAPMQALTFSLSAGGNKITQPVTVIAPEDGHYSLTVQFSHESDGRVRSVSRAVTFYVGDRAQVLSKSRNISNGAEPGVVSLPAQETIHPHTQ